MNNKLKSFSGEHCETTATGTLLLNLEIELSEPMLFGLGEGLGFGVIKFGKMPFPFLGGRIKTGLITPNLCKNLGLSLDIKRTTSQKKAWNNVKDFLDRKIPVGLQLDSYYLDYFTKKIHFAGHYVAITDYDEQYAYLVDTAQQGTQSRTTLENLALARNSKQPMADKNMSYTITKSGNTVDLEKAILNAVKTNSEDFLNPPIKNFGYKGLLKASKEIEGWYDKFKNADIEFQTMGMLMEKSGTGGGFFRKIYSHFLHEAFEITNKDCLEEAAIVYEKCAILWAEVSSLFTKTGEERDKSYLKKASELFNELYTLEYETQKKLNLTLGIEFF